jgi:hypothetical protein
MFTAVHVRRPPRALVVACVTLTLLGCGFGRDGQRKPAPAAAPSLAAVDPCKLITDVDVRPYVSETYHVDRFGTAGGLGARGQRCAYFAYANAVDDSEVSVLVSDDPMTADKMKSRADKWVRESTDTIAPLPGVGDLAYVATAKDFGEVWVLLGNRALVVYVRDKGGQFVKDAAIAVARRAATRFPDVAAGR